MSAEVGPSLSTINRHLRKLGLMNWCCRQVFHDVNNNVWTFANNYIPNLQYDCFYGGIITRDEKWIYFHNINKKKSVDSFMFGFSICCQTMAVWTKGHEFFWACHTWSCCGRWYLCSRAVASISWFESCSYPALINRKRVLLQHDNVPA